MSQSKQYCFCRKEDSGEFMICCTNCSLWCHGSCVNIDKKESNRIENWYCGSCINSNPSLKIVYNEAADVEAQSEATFRLTIKDFSNIKEIVSPPCYVRNLSWRIKAKVGKQPAGHDRQGHNVGQQESLGFFLRCNGESESTIWSCNAQADLRILPQKEGCQLFSRRIQHVFNSKEQEWGISRFLPWADIMDPEKGFVKDDTIILEVRVSADAPHGVKHTGKTPPPGEPRRLREVIGIRPVPSLMPKGQTFRNINIQGGPVKIYFMNRRRRNPYFGFTE